MKGSPISPRPAAKAAHPHPAGAEVMRPRRDAVQSLPSDLLAGSLREAITKRRSGIGTVVFLMEHKEYLHISSAIRLEFISSITM